MSSERSINFLAHPSCRPPRASKAAESRGHLLRDGYKGMLDPQTEDPLTDQYINREFKTRAARDLYVTWRNSNPQGHLFLMSNRIGRLAAAAWIAPRYGADEQMRVPTMAVATAHLYENSLNMGTHFMTVTHALAFCHYEYVKQGIMMERVKSAVLMQACGAIGYQAASEEFNDMDINSGNRGVDMVVSSGPLAALNASRMEDTPLPPTSEAPQLRIIKGKMGD